MSTGYKSAKAELVAIYRLEFYRKQKSWKFSKDVRKEAARKKQTGTAAKKILNETYNVAVPSTDAAACELNEAFVDSGSDTNVATEPDHPGETNLAKCLNSSGTEPMKPEAVFRVTTPTPVTPDKLHQDPVSLPKPDQDWSHKVAASENKWSDLAHYWQEPEILPEQTEDWLKTKLWSTAQNIWQEKNWSPWDKGLLWTKREGDGELEVTRWVDVSYNGCEEGWPRQSQVWTNAGQEMAEADWDVGIPVELEQVGDMEQQLARSPPPALPLPPPPGLCPPPWDAARDYRDILEWRPCVDADAEAEAAAEAEAEAIGERSEESACEFILGAHAAPHSSELDLRAPTAASRPVPELCASLSLGHLLNLNYRPYCSEPRAEPYDGSYEEYPTRDVGLYRLAEPYAEDIFLAGSFMNHPGFDVGSPLPGFDGGHAGFDMGSSHPGLNGCHAGFDVGGRGEGFVTPPPGWDGPWVSRGRGRLRRADEHATGLGRGRLHRV